MNIILRKSLALLLCLCLCISLFPASYADDQAEEFFLNNEVAFEAARGVAVNTVTFPDPAFRAYVEENCDANGDLVLTDTEIAAVTEMDVHGLGIADLTGVDVFTQLETLICSDNMLRELDVRMLPYLEQLYCQNNFIVTEGGEDAGLASLFPSPATKVLWCYNNMLSAGNLHLEDCPHLEYLDCSYNPLGTLDLSSVPALLELRCNNADLETLDLQYTPDLCVLWCWIDFSALSSRFLVNSFTEIDLTYCPRLANVVAYGSVERYTFSTAFFDGESEVSVYSGFYYNLGAPDPGIPYVTLILGEERGGSVTVKSETGSTGGTALDTLFPDDHFRAYVAETIDTDHDGQLSYPEREAVVTIDCSNREISSLDGIAAFYNLKTLNCSSNALTSLNLWQNSNLTSLNCDDNQLAQLNISNLYSLQLLSCSGNPLTAISLSGVPTLLACLDRGQRVEGETSVSYYLSADDNEATPVLDNYIGVLTVGKNVLVYDSIPINETNFPDEAFRSYLYQFDQDGDETLSDWELQSLTSIDCSGTYEEPGSISNLSGIGFFPFLSSLNCSNNALTALDVSSNPNLTELNCSDNALTALDVSNNAKLANLFCAGNSLESLDVSHNPSLGSFYCGNNALTALNVSSNPNLIYLHCEGNGLSALDVTHNEKLIYLSCSDNHLQEVDLSHNPALEALECQNNQLEALELHSTHLDLLDCSGNAIDSVDISNCDHLELALTKGNRSESGSSVRYLYQFTAMMDYGFTQVEIPRIYALMFDRTTEIITTADLIALFPDDAFRLYIRDNFDANHDGSLSTEEIAAATAIDVSGLGVSDLTGIKLFTELTTLNCSDNKLTSLDVDGLTKLKTLYCQNNLIGSVSEVVLAASPSLSATAAPLNIGSAPLEVLWCYNNSLSGLDLSACHTLVDLDCAYNQLETLNVTGLPALTTLRCNDNALMGLNLQANPLLTYLWCWNNPIEDLDISHCPNLVDAVEYGAMENFFDHVSLFNHWAEVSISLYTALYRGGAVDAGVPVTATYFPDREFRAFVRVNVDRNYDGVLSDYEIEQADYLDCSSWGIESVEGVNYLTGLKWFVCRNNYLTSIDVSGIAGLAELDCSYNQIDTLNVTGNTELKRLRAVSNNLSELDLSANKRLAVLWCWYNNIETLDLTASPMLSTLALDGIIEYYGGDRGNYVSRYDKSGIGDLSTDETVEFLAEVFVALNAENFPDENFLACVRTFAEEGSEYLSQKQIDAIKELNCANQSIENLTGIQFFTSLTKLNCSGNSLQQLDISALSALTELNCSGNSLRALNTSRNPALLTLNCSHNLLTAVTFSNNYALTNLDCSHNSLEEFSVVDCDTISEFINTGVQAATADGVTTYAGTLTRGGGEVHQVSFSYDAATRVLYLMPDLVLPADLSVIEENAFSGGAFKFVKLPNRAVTIGPNAFADCPNLLYIYVPATAEIDQTAFGDLTELRIFGRADTAIPAFAQAHGFVFIALP